MTWAGGCCGLESWHVRPAGAGQLPRYVIIGFVGQVVKVGAVIDQWRAGSPVVTLFGLIGVVADVADPGQVTVTVRVIHLCGIASEVSRWIGQHGQNPVNLFLAGQALRATATPQAEELVDRCTTAASR